MLKGLDLHGFKSFADRTQFAFDAGITMVVGPNGSGKSNVVDAIKWVLGTQSVKSLRGTEMSDVIFSGSASRRPANAAEVSLTFDNASGLFDLDATEVELTRRVYRSGEVEYLVNRQTRRLRDLRDLLSDAGLTTSAYCVIEQGKVDSLLQSTPKQRRTLFEEAAGISRFKTKREEAARRLERVQQNLLRLTDLVEELQGRLRTVRLQAGKARKYSELAERLKFLRTGTALSDYREYSQKIAQIRTSQEAAQLQAAQLEQDLQRNEEAVAGIDAEASEAHQRLRKTLSEDGKLRQNIAQCLSNRSSQLARIDELAWEQQRIARQILSLSTRTGDSLSLVNESRAAVALAQTTFRELKSQVEQGAIEVELLEAQHSEAAQQEDKGRSECQVAQRNAMRLANSVEVLDAKIEATREALAGRLQQQTTLAENAKKLREQSDKASQTLHAATTELETAQSTLTAIRHRVATGRQRLATLQRDVVELQRQLTGVRERAAVLEELERRLDGLTAGAREALRCAAADPEGPFGAIRGVVADLLEVDADSAAMIEAALGERSGYLVVDSAQRLCVEMARRSPEWPGRVCFLRLDAPAPASAVDRVDLTGEPGVIGRADHFVQTAPDLDGLARRLLGRIWLVDSLDTAFALSAERGRGLSFVTSLGELVSLDGSLIVGPQQNATGLLSRRRELRSASQRAEGLHADLEQRERECQEAIAANESDELAVEQLSLQTSHLQQAVGECRPTAMAAQQRYVEIERQLADLLLEQTNAEKLLQELETQRTATLEQQREAEHVQTHWQQEIERANERKDVASDSLVVKRRDLIDQRISLAGADQRREGLERQLEQLVRERQERQQALDDMNKRLQECAAQKKLLLCSVLDLSSQSAELYRRRDAMTCDRHELASHDHNQRSQRERAAKSCNVLRSQLLQQQHELQKAQLQVQQLEHQRSDLGERLFDDHQVSLEQLALDANHAWDADLPSRSQADQEMADLRHALKNVGPVNLEALEELDELEKRWQTLASQHEDLNNAQARLAGLVAQLNGESRQLFAATLDEIRGHFRELFTTLFGGGEADIIVEDDEQGDILECGVNIVARPPGKQPRSISLLSGGERTLTCVALLLAVFKSRPSPFCVLDEVDAALDEANIDRFVRVVKDFMHSTQFIIVTHSKRTMSCSNTIYGVTMQESGVSKRVSVRFEDVDAKGRLRIGAAPPDRGDEGPSQNRQAA